MPSTTETPVPTSKSGIQTSATGDSFIPASVRADGSTRKEIKVRPGYRPPEDVEVYKNRTAQAWKGRGGGGIPGAEGLKKEAEGNVKTSNKNSKRRDARKKASTAAKAYEGDANVKDISTADGPVKQENGGPGSDTREKDEVDEEAEKEKKARNLKKKLRQARELREKKDHGESLLPEQLAKVVKIQELIRDLNKLGFDAEGERKTDAEEQTKD